MDRKEAIEIIIKNYPHVSNSGSQFESALRELIPELQESEDKRIMKDIIQFLRDASNSKTRVISSETLAKWADYLEKQKKNTEGDFARGYDCGYECCLNSHGAEWLEKQKEQKPGDEDRYMEGYMRGIGEQQPAEWSEEDEKMLCNVYESLYAYQCDIRAGRMDKNARELLDDVDAEKAWLKSLPARFHFAHWKPTEEQMEALRLAYEIGTANKSWAMSVLKSLYNNLKSLYEL